MGWPKEWLEDYNNKFAATNAKRARECAIADGYGVRAIDSMTTYAVAESLRKMTAPEDPHTKYKNRPTGGYASVKEARRAAELKLLEKGGAISHLREQVPYLLIPNQFDTDGKCIERGCKYFADFVYEKDGHTVVEDTKSDITKTPEYIIKRKLLLFVHHLQILET
jgi:uncharacterized protein with ATP-grasp and redox domains